MLRSLMSPKCEDAVAALGGRAGLRHVLHHDVARGEAADQHRALIADHGRQPVFLVQGVGGGAGAGFLAEAEVNAADYLSLLVEIFERRFHLAVEQHPAVDLDALLLVKIFRFADGWNGRAEVACDFVADFAAFADLADMKLWLFQAIVGNGIGALVGVGGIPRGLTVSCLFLLLGHVRLDLTPC